MPILCRSVASDRCEDGGDPYMLFVALCRGDGEVGGFINIDIGLAD